jgi:hypothetical protein
MREFDNDTSWGRSGKMRFGGHISYYARGVIVEDGKKCAFAATGRNLGEALINLDSYTKNGCTCWFPRPEKICPVHAEAQG